MSIRKSYSGPVGLAVIVVAIAGAWIYCELPLSVRETRDTDGTLIRTQLDFQGQPHGIEHHYTLKGAIHKETEYSHGAAIVKRQYYPSGRIMFVWTLGSDHRATSVNYLDEPGSPKQPGAYQDGSN